MLKISWTRILWCIRFMRGLQKKKHRAQELVEQALRTQEGMVSTQVVQEFLNVATTKFTVPLRFSDVQQYLQDELGSLCSVFPSIDLFRQALVQQQDTQYSFYDSLIIGGVQQAGCETLYSEDLQHGQQIRGLKILNPFISSS